VANELGAGSARRAKFAIYNVVITSSLIGFVLFVLFLFFRGSLAYIFTESREVADAVSDLSPLLAFSILLNSVQPVLSGIHVSQSYRMIDAGAMCLILFILNNVTSSYAYRCRCWCWLAKCNITSYYLIGIPLGAVLGYFVGFCVLHQVKQRNQLSVVVNMLQWRICVSLCRCLWHWQDCCPASILGACYCPHQSSVVVVVWGHLCSLCVYICTYN
jgi:Na+-driven multidrug efflux pump